MSYVEDKVLNLILEGLSEGEKNYYKDLKVLVVGGAGFIGSWLSEALVRLDSNVTCLDSLVAGSKDNVARLAGKPNFKLVVEDVTSFELKEPYDMIFYGAAIPAPDAYTLKPVEALLTESVGLYRALVGARKFKSKVVYMSSSEVYGDPEIVPTPESYYGRVNPIGPRSPYEEGKRFGEALSIAFYKEYDVDVRIARIFNTYGPRLDPGAPYSRVVTRFVERALKGLPLEVHGDGLQTRSFTFISDTVRALLKLGCCEKCSGDVLNVGNDEEVTIRELAELVLKLTGSNSPIIHVPPRPLDPRRRKPNIKKARELLGWEPLVPLAEGLKLTIEWYRRRRGVEGA